MKLTSNYARIGLIFSLCLPIFSQAEFSVNALESNGQLTWSNYPSAVNYRVEWTSDLDSGQWYSSWSNLNAIAATGSTYSVQVPMFYRVVVDTDPDNDDDGWTVGQGDCNDADPAINPDAVEIWYDGVDQDCDGESDYDRDGDGYDSELFGGFDCDDDNPTRHPGAPEICNNFIDDNCDGSIDEDCDDLDEDGWTTEQGDCNDADPAINPDATEIWYDGVDQNCDGESDYDRDGDGYDSESFGGFDCNDDDPTQNPGAPEICDNFIDDNCDGQIDENCP